MFVEKPLSVKPPEEVADLSARLHELQKQRRLMIAVGYQLRYCPAVEVGCSHVGSVSLPCNMAEQAMATGRKLFIAAAITLSQLCCS